MWLFHYVEEARRLCRFVQIASGALRLPCASIASCVLLSVCCCAPRRTVLAISFESAHDLWLSRGLEFAMELGMWGSWCSGLAVKSAGATFV